jgi:hypothetical protein
LPVLPDAGPVAPAIGWCRPAALKVLVAPITLVTSVNGPVAPGPRRLGGSPRAVIGYCRSTICALIAPAPTAEMIET